MTKYDPEFLQKLQQGIDGVIKQGKQSLSRKYGCVYHGKGGNKCFIGQGIPDNNYKSSFECRTIENLNVQEAWIGRKLSILETTIAREFQRAHDDWKNNSYTGFVGSDISFVEHFKYCCQLIIEEYNLPFTIPQGD